LDPFSLLRFAAFPEKKNGVATWQKNSLRTTHFSRSFERPSWDKCQGEKMKSKKI